MPPSPVRGRKVSEQIPRPGDLCRDHRRPAHPGGGAAPAGAATSSCTGVSSISHGGLTFEMPTLGNNTRNVNCSLGVGNNSGAVRILQINLNDCYWSGSTTRGHASAFSPALSEDGDFGAHTKAALKAAQSTISSISHDGMYGPQTRANILFFADDGQLGRCAKCGA